MRGGVSQSTPPPLLACKPVCRKQLVLWYNIRGGQSQSRPPLRKYLFFKPDYNSHLSESDRGGLLVRFWLNQSRSEQAFLPIVVTTFAPPAPLHMNFSSVTGRTANGITWGFTFRRGHVMHPSYDAWLESLWLLKVSFSLTRCIHARRARPGTEIGLKF